MIKLDTNNSYYQKKVCEANSIFRMLNEISNNIIYSYDYNINTSVEEMVPVTLSIHVFRHIEDHISYHIQNEKRSCGFIIGDIYQEGLDTFVNGEKMLTCSCGETIYITNNIFGRNFFGMNFYDFLSKINWALNFATKSFVTKSLYKPDKIDKNFDVDPISQLEL